MGENVFLCIAWLITKKCKANTSSQCNRSDKIVGSVSAANVTASTQEMASNRIFEFCNHRSKRQRYRNNITSLLRYYT
jgi:hypothetical protein